MSIHPELRIGDREREAAASALGEHFAEGRINREEYDERSAAVWSARTEADLRPVFADLPGPHHARLGHARPDRVATLSAPSRGRPASSGGSRFPLLPLLLILIGMAVLVNGWPVLLLAAVLWWVVVRRMLRSAGGLCRPPR